MEEEREEEDGDRDEEESLPFLCFFLPAPIYCSLILVAVLLIKCVSSKYAPPEADIELLGGDFHLTSHPGHGTRVAADVPLSH